MTNIEYVLESINFIENNLRNEISAFDVSNKIGYSFFHFSRLFHGVTGFSIKSYILYRRLSESVHDLVNTKQKIIEIAFEYQFGSHEAYTRAFRQQFGVSPMEVRKGISITSFPLLNRLTKESIERSKIVRDFKFDIVELPEIILVGYQLFVKHDESGRSITELWYKFHNEVRFINNRIIPEKYYQVQSWSENQELDGLFFFLGIEVKDLDEVPPNFSIKIIPLHKYLHFTHKGLSNKVGYTYKYIYNEFLPKTNFKLTIPFNFEYYGDRFLGPNNEESESDIYIPTE